MTHLETRRLVRPYLSILVSLAALFSSACDHAKDLVEQGKKQAEDIQKSMEGKKDEVANSGANPAPPVSSTETANNSGTVAAPQTPAAVPPKNFGQLVEEFMKQSPAVKNDQLLQELGSIPEEYRGRLTECDLTDSRVTDAGLMELAKFPNLISVNASKCTGVSGNGLAGIKDLVHLEHLRLDGTQVSDASMAHLQNLTHLKVLNLNHTKVTDLGIAKIQELPQLEELYLVATKIDGSGFRKVKMGNSLRILDASESSFGIAGMPGLAGQKSLEVVNLNRAQVSDKTVGSLKALGKLRVLDLSNNPLTDRGVKQLPGLNSLEELQLASTQITDECLTSFKTCKNLRLFNVRLTSVADSGQAYIKKIAPNCTVLAGR